MFKITKYKQLRRNRLLTGAVLICIMLLFGLKPATAQVVTYSHNYIGSEVVTDHVFGGDTIINHSEKSVNWTAFDSSLWQNIYKSVNLYRLNSTGGYEYSALLLYDSQNVPADNDPAALSNDSVNVFKFPKGYYVYDIELFDSTLYFCGQYRGTEPREHDGNGIIERDTLGFIGWIPASQLFAGTDTAHYFTTCYNLNNIRVFRDTADGVVKVAAIEQYKQYGNSSRVVASFSPITYTYIITPAKYYDCMYLYNPSGQSRMFRCKAYNESDVEHFEDLIFANGNIDVISSRYELEEEELSPLLYTPDSTLTSNKVYYRSINTQTFDQHVNRIDIRWLDLTSNLFFDENIRKGVYNLKLDYRNAEGWMDDDADQIIEYDYGYLNYPEMMYEAFNNIVLSFNHYENRTNPYYATIQMGLFADNLETDDSVLRSDFSARIWEGNNERKLINVKRLGLSYFPQINGYPIGENARWRKFFSSMVITEDTSGYDHLEYVPVIGSSGYIYAAQTYTGRNDTISSYNTDLCVPLVDIAYSDGIESVHINDVSQIIKLDRFPMYRAIGNAANYNHFGRFYQFSNEQVMSTYGSNPLWTDCLNAQLRVYAQRKYSVFQTHKVLDNDLLEYQSVVNVQRLRLRKSCGGLDSGCFNPYLDKEYSK